MNQKKKDTVSSLSLHIKSQSCKGCRLFYGLLKHLKHDDEVSLRNVKDVESFFIEA